MRWTPDVDIVLCGHLWIPIIRCRMIVIVIGRTSRTTTTTTTTSTGTSRGSGG